MDLNRHKLSINGKDLANYGVEEAEKPVITMPKTEYKRVNVIGRYLPKYQNENRIKTGTMNLELYGVFKTPTDRENFERDVIASLNHRAINVIEFNWAPNTEYLVGMESQVTVEDITDWEAHNSREQVVKYSIPLVIEYVRRKVREGVLTDTVYEGYLDENKQYTFELVSTTNGSSFDIGEESYIEVNGEFYDIVTIITTWRADLLRRLVIDSTLPGIVGSQQLGYREYGNERFVALYERPLPIIKGVRGLEIKHNLPGEVGEYKIWEVL